MLIVLIGIKMTLDHLVDIQTWTVYGTFERLLSVRFKAIITVFKC